MLTKVLQPAAVDAGLGQVTWHQFRHIRSSLLNDLNVPSKIAQEQLGHASISTTLGIYTRFRRHIATRSKRWKSACSRNCSRMFLNPRTGLQPSSREVKVLIRFRIGGAARI